ncbi:prolipoprotein diacylglyceryl transferase [Spiroplasma tabanidicola]|uniref:Prolipoprotein diacylglyceryl transferase n=1 Tax=Spiroplasma tabanidicola TaxID=324079 RepID=A0A6I6C9E6_9MOLU|nr:prolipoprotein diacylglyceryl transferase family protein [Spiroplasma tabanidicola]QGS51521.1 prolipoprotein diacylglyceryl transferase [Spiroplasma tabanidicola]
MEKWEDKWFSPYDANWSVKSDYGPLHMYAFFITTGVIVAIALAAFRLWRRRLPAQEMLIAAVFIVPCGLFGGSFFGKLNASGDDWLNGEGFFKLFAFWEPGMSIHGAILFGTISAFLILYFLRKKRKISLFTYGDCIAPGILISQSVGRWGNFFNHELFGRPLGIYGGVNLPKWLQDNLTYTYNGPSGNVLNGVTLENGQHYVMQPLFLYESVGFLIVYLCIVLIIPGIGKWIGKKPWKVEPNQFQLSWKESWKAPFTFNKDSIDNTYFEIWRNAFYTKVEKSRVNWYEQEKSKITTKNIVAKKWKEGLLLDKANNPHGYKCARAGVQLGAYFLGWNIIRFYVETNRSEEGLFVMHKPELSLALVAITGIVGVIIMIYAQFIGPYLFRTPGYIYEKPYFFTREVLEKDNKIADRKIKNSVVKMSEQLAIEAERKQQAKVQTQMKNQDSKKREVNKSTYVKHPSRRMQIQSKRAKHQNIKTQGLNRKKK